MNRVSIMKYVLLAFGALMLAIAGIDTHNTRSFVAQSAHAHGTVTDLVRRHSSDSDTYAPVVRFATADGENVEFTSETASNPPGYSRGERVDVIYRPLAPQHAKIDDFTSLWASPLMFGALGAIAFGVGAGVLLNAIFRARRAAELKRSGKRLLTTVHRVERNDNVKVNGRNPYRIFTQCKGATAGEARIFESDNVWCDPSAYLNGRNINVFVEPGNADRYYVDLSFLPESVR